MLSWSPTRGQELHDYPLLQGVRGTGDLGVGRRQRGQWNHLKIYFKRLSLLGKPTIPSNDSGSSLVALCLKRPTLPLPRIHCLGEIFLTVAYHGKNFEYALKAVVFLKPPKTWTFASMRFGLWWWSQPPAFIWVLLSGLESGVIVLDLDLAWIIEWGILGRRKMD